MASKNRYSHADAWPLNIRQEIIEIVIAKMNTNNSGKAVGTIDKATVRKLWIHCNKCFALYIHKERIIFLLACQHVICERCVTVTLGRMPNDAPTYKCPMCGKQVRGRQVNNALPPNLKDMFHPEPWADGLNHRLITSFQRAHHISIDEHIQRKLREWDKIDKDIELAQKLCRKHYLEQHRLRLQRKQAEYHLRKVRRQAQIRKQEALRRRRSVSDVETNVPMRKRSASAEPKVQERKRRASAEPTRSAITSFIHDHNHSFIL